MERSIVDFLEKKLGNIDTVEVIKDLIFEVPLKVTDKKILSMTVKRQDDVTEQTLNTDFTFSKNDGTITILSAGTWGSDVTFIATLKVRDFAEFTNELDIRERPTENLSDSAPYILVHEYPGRFTGPHSSKTPRFFLDTDDRFKGETQKKFLTRIQIDLEGEDDTQVSLMYEALMNLGKVLFIPFLDYSGGAPVAKGFITIEFDPSFEVDWDRPRRTVEYRGNVTIINIFDVLTMTDLAPTWSVNGEEKLFPPVPEVPSEILTFDDDFLYSASPEPSIEDSDWILYFG